MGLRIKRLTRLGTQVGAVAVMAIASLAFGVVTVEVGARPSQDGGQPSRGTGGPDGGKVEASRKDPPKPNPPQEKVGLILNDPRAFQGYTLIAPMGFKKTYLIDMQGRVVRTWVSDCDPAVSAYLLPDGHMLRPGMLDGEQQRFGSGPGAGGKVQEFTWEGELAWDFKYVSEKRIPHHDITKLPNGNVLLIVWEKRNTAEAIAAGRSPGSVGSAGLHPDCLVEVKPTGKTTGEVVWEWHLWDHLVQDYDKTKPNHGNVSDHPELVDINFGGGEGPIAPMMATKDGVAKLRSLGYLGNSPPPKDTPKPAPKDTPKDSSKGPPNRGPGRQGADWTHFNGVDYNAKLDQIVVSVHSFSELWVIDHSTTTAEAASHTGGRSGKGGDLLYRWGNPRAFRNGSKTDQRLFNQHNAHWIPAGLPGGGHMLIFNNGSGRPGGEYSSVDEIVLPIDSQGQYSRKRRGPYGPDKPVWSYSAPKKSDFYSFFISGAQRLPNGNTLICSGASGTVFEVGPKNEVVWKYANPVKGSLGGLGFQPGGVTLLPFFLRDQLNLTPEQTKQIDTVQKELGSSLDKTLTDAQRKQLRAINPFGPDGFKALPLPGQIISTSTQAALKPTPEQKKQLDDLQAKADGTLDKVLNADQKKQLKEMREGFARGNPFAFGPPGGPPGPPGGPGGPPGGPGGPPGGPGRPPGGPGGPGGPPGGPGFGPPGNGRSLFRAYRYAPDYPGLAGKELKPGKTVEELQSKEPEKK